MNIGIIGEMREPVRPAGVGGLARATWDIATELQKRGHEVTLYAQFGSEFERVIYGALVPDRHDVVLDYSHDHRISWHYGFDAPVVNLIGDRECLYMPPNALVESVYMLENYPRAKKIKAGIHVESIPFTERADGDYLLFAGLHVAHKGVKIARHVASAASMPIKFIGPGGEGLGLPGYLGNVDEDTKWRLMGNALGVLCPYTIDASPRVPLEAAACGTPTICLDNDGTRDHVYDRLTGFVCHNTGEMIAMVGHLSQLNREKIRIWVAQNHNIDQHVDSIEQALVGVAEGVRW